MKTLSTILAALLLAAGPGQIAAQSSLSADEVLDGYDVPADDRQKIIAGEVVAYDGEQWERTDRELAADAIVMIERPLDEIARGIRGSATIIPEKYLREFREIESLDDFAEVAFSVDEIKEVEKLLSADGGKDYNLSDAELAMVKEVAKTSARLDDAGKAEAASALMRDILVARYQAYLESGLQGIPEYRRSRRKVVSIGDELRMTTETLNPIEGEFLPYYQTLLNYPAGADCCEHVFRWLKVRLRKRPTFALSHTMLEQTDTHLVVTERHYFVSNTLNSTQITLFWVPYDEGSHMGLAISASTDVLESFMGRMLRPLGRNKARDLVSETLTEIRDDLEAAESE